MATTVTVHLHVLDGLAPADAATVALELVNAAGDVAPTFTVDGDLTLGAVTTVTDEAGDAFADLVPNVLIDRPAGTRWRATITLADGERLPAQFAMIPTAAQAVQPIEFGEWLAPAWSTTVDPATAYQARTDRGQPDGYAPLDSDGDVVNAAGEKLTAGALGDVASGDTTTVTLEGAGTPGDPLRAAATGAVALTADVNALVGTVSDRVALIEALGTLETIVGAAQRITDLRAEILGGDVQADLDSIRELAAKLNDEDDALAAILVDLDTRLTEAVGDTVYRRLDVPLVDGDVPAGVARDVEVLAAFEAAEAAEVTIGELAAAGALTGGEFVALEQAGFTVHATIDAIVAARSVPKAGGTIAGDLTVANPGFLGAIRLGGASAAHQFGLYQGAADAQPIIALASVFGAALVGLGAGGASVPDVYLQRSNVGELTVAGASFAAGGASIVVPIKRTPRVTTANPYTFVLGDLVRVVEGNSSAARSMVIPTFAAAGIPVGVDLLFGRVNTGAITLASSMVRQITDAGITNASAVVTTAQSLATDVDRIVTGPGIPAGTRILSVVAGVSFTMTANATATAAAQTVDLGVIVHDPQALTLTVGTRWEFRYLWQRATDEWVMGRLGI